MLRPLICILTIVLFSGLTISSCKKDADPPPQTGGDSIKSVLPPQITTIKTYASGGKDSSVISIKYDTANHHIELYVANATNTKPFDQLAVRYTYNNDGYLVEINGYEENSFVDIPDHMNLMINRGNDNKIIDIKYFDEKHVLRVTSFYSYQTIGDTTIIKTIDHQDGYNDDTLYYKFTNDHKLISLEQFVKHYDGPLAQGKITYYYNTNNRLRKSATKMVILTSIMN